MITPAGECCRYKTREEYMIEVRKKVAGTESWLETAPEDTRGIESVDENTPARPNRLRERS